MDGNYILVIAEPLEFQYHFQKNEGGTFFKNPNNNIFKWKM